MTLTLEPIYDALNADLRRFIARRVDDPAAVDDLLQDVYLRIHARLPGLRDVDRLHAWVFQIARNAIADYYRRQRPTPELLDDLAEPEAPDDEAARQVARSLGDMLTCLPDKYRQAIELTDLQGLTQQALADCLGLSLSGAKSRVQRAREQLKAVMLDCCHVELDRLGHVLSYEPRCEACAQPDYFVQLEIKP